MGSRSVPAYARPLDFSAATSSATSLTITPLLRFAGGAYAVVVSAAAVVPIEFKVGATRHVRADYEQAWDYALDLKNFHEGVIGW